MAEKRVPASELAKTKEQIKPMKKIQGSASGGFNAPSNSMIKSNPRSASKLGSNIADSVTQHLTNNYRVTAKEAADIVKHISKKFGK